MKYTKLMHRIIWYIEPAEYWVYKDVHIKKNYIIQILILVINNLWSAEEMLNLSLVPYEPVNKSEESNKTTQE